MNDFHYQDDHLHVEAVPLSQLAERFGTPFYVYSTAALQAQVARLRAAMDGFKPHYCYAVKANSHRAILRTLFDAGMGADIVSEGELRRCLSVGLAPEKITFSGVGKSEQEIRYALQQGVQHFNVESEPELQRIGALAAQLQLTARVTLRVNPDVAADTHEKISTGKSENKFGIPWDRIPGVYAAARGWPHVEMSGLHMHIGSQIHDTAPYAKAMQRMAELVRVIRAQGDRVEVVDLGGGFGVSYDATDAREFDFQAYADAVREHIQPLGVQLMLEPGRYLVACAGALVSKVEYIKQGATSDFLIIDAGMNDLIRPSLYDAWHDILPVQAAPSAAKKIYDVVGPVCETGDTFARGRCLPEFQQGDLLAILHAGAYGAVMASTYNTRPQLPEILVNGDRVALIRARQSFAELLAQEHLPDWLPE